MGTKEKLRERFLKMPSDFTFEDNIIKSYAMKQVYEDLKEAGFIQ